MRGRELWLNFDSSAGRRACRRRSCRKGVKRTPICCSSCTRANHFYSRLVETLHLGTRCIVYPSLFEIVTIGVYQHSSQTITKVEKWKMRSNLGALFLQVSVGWGPRAKYLRAAMCPHPTVPGTSKPWNWGPSWNPAVLKLLSRLPIGW